MAADGEAFATISTGMISGCCMGIKESLHEIEWRGVEFGLD
jgi:hypothetical protein